MTYLKNIVGWILVGIALMGVFGALIGGFAMHKLIAAALWAIIAYLVWYFVLRNNKSD